MKMVSEKYMGCSARIQCLQIVEGASECEEGEIAELEVCGDDGWVF